MTRITSFDDEGSGNSSHIVDLGGGVAAVIDPVRDVVPYLEHAAAADLLIGYALETHLHADFLSGSQELRAHGATVIAPKDARLGFPHRPVVTGEEIVVGDVLLRAMGSPGHTPEHTSYLVIEAETPVALFSGGALLPGGAARTDLLSADETEPLTRALLSSIAEALRTLPADLGVYPTHGAGSFCAVPGTGPRVTTIGHERASNPLFPRPGNAPTIAGFLGSLGTYPPFFRRLRPINQAGPALIRDLSPPPMLDANRVAALMDRGAALIDVRPIERWAAAHIPGSLSNELRPAFATWLGWLVPEPRTIAFVADDDTVEAAVTAARSIGFDDIAGRIDIETWRASGAPTASTPLVPIETWNGVLVDVRQRSEFVAGHVPGAVHIELGSIDAADLPGGPVAIACGHGERAASAASLLERAGRADVSVLTGGPRDWSRSTGHALTSLD